MKLKGMIGLLAFLSIVGFGPFSGFFPSAPSSSTSSWIENQIRNIDSRASNLDPYVLKLGLKAYMKARQIGYDTKGLLTIIDYSKLSTEKRLWVIDLNTDRILFNTWVCHGKNSGILQATSFSNQPSTLKSSLGVFITDNSPYFGSNGYSLRLKGLERGINDNAYRRDIVFHGAWYAMPEVIQQYGVLGRSWGCPAVPLSIVKPFIDTVKQQTVVLVYYPNRTWLGKSSFLRG